MIHYLRKRQSDQNASTAKKDSALVLDVDCRVRNSSTGNSLKTECTVFRPNIIRSDAEILVLCRLSSQLSGHLGVCFDAMSFSRMSMHDACLGE